MELPKVIFIITESTATYLSKVKVPECCITDSPWTLSIFLSVLCTAAFKAKPVSKFIKIPSQTSDVSAKLKSGSFLLLICSVSLTETWLGTQLLAAQCHRVFINFVINDSQGSRALRMGLPPFTKGSHSFSQCN